MNVISSFPPVSTPQARVLILGTMPGVASLDAVQYYAHPRNLFWKIMGELTGAHPHMPYSARLETLKDKNIAVWDVLQCCIRTGSLDSRITQEGANDFAAFFAAHPDIRHVFFNGAPAAKFFKKFVMPEMKDEFEKRGMQFTTLPSTSPANASWSYELKMEKWKEILS